VPAIVNIVDAGLVWAVVGSVAGVIAAGAGGWQLRLQILERRELRGLRAPADKTAVSGTGALPVAAPLGQLPAEVRGRDPLIAELRRSLPRWRRHPNRLWVLAGMGGLGKSTVALAVAESARARRRQVWWVAATDVVSLNGGMLEVLHQLGAPESVTRPVREGAPTAPVRAWEFLNGAAPGCRWLLVFDNADDPAVLGAGAATPADGTGWLPRNPAGMVVVTTRNKDPRVWGPAAVLRELRPLDDATAARVLTDLAPGVLDRTGQQARDLGRRLGGLPLALHSAGTYLASPFAHWRSFADYQGALDSADFSSALAELDDPGTLARATIQRTWDLSLQALTAGGRAQARQLLLLLSCYAPATPIAVTLLQPGLLAGMLAPPGQDPAGTAQDMAPGWQRRLRDAGLDGLATLGLIDIVTSQSGDRAVAVHPVVADVNRSRLLSPGRTDVPAIGGAALGLLQAAVEELDSRRQADWLAWRPLVPHVTAVLGWLAGHLDTATLADCVDIAAKTARALMQSGNSAAAEDLARSAVTAAARLGTGNPASLLARSVLAWAIGEQGRFEEAEQLYRQVLAGRQSVLGAEHADTLFTRHALGWAIGEQGRYKEAEQLYRGLLEDQRRALGTDHRDTLGTRANLAWVIGGQGRYREAENLYRELLDDLRRVLGDDDPLTLETRHALGRVIACQGRWEEAERLYRELLDDRRRVLGDQHPDTLFSHDNLGWVIGGQGRHADAERLHRQTLARRQHVLGDEHPDTLLSRHNLARALSGQGKQEEAERLSRHVLAARRTILGDEHPDTLRARSALTDIVASQGKHEEAEELYRQLLTDQQRIMGPEHPETLATRNSLARLTVADERASG
jgi:tetratricopeptide (TPR) repeat protein